jgi:hypothetical protein
MLRVNKIFLTIKIINFKESVSNTGKFFVNIKGQTELKESNELKTFTKNFILFSEKAENIIDEIKINDQLYIEGFFNSNGSITVNHWSKLN